MLYAVVLGVSFLLFQQDSSTPLNRWAGVVLVALLGLLIPGVFFYQARKNWLADRKQWAFPLFLLGLFWLFRAIGMTVDVINMVLRLTP